MKLSLVLIVSGETQILSHYCRGKLSALIQFYGCRYSSIVKISLKCWEKSVSGIVTLNPTRWHKQLPTQYSKKHCCTHWRKFVSQRVQIPLRYGRLSK